jgi:hypothetical protein
VYHGHGYFPDHPSMRAMLVMSGAGIGKGRQPGEKRRYRPDAGAAAWRITTNRIRPRPHRSAPISPLHGVNRRHQNASMWVYLTTTPRPGVCSISANCDSL